jgi:PAS domain-containing protein
MLRQDSPAGEFALVARADDRVRERPVLFPGAALRRADSRMSALSELLAAGDLDASALDTLIERLPIGVAIADRDGRLVCANAAARALTLSHIPDLRSMVADAIMTGAEVRDEQCAYRDAGGARRWLAIRVSPVQDGDCQIALASITIWDATERIQATEWRPLIESLARL